MLKLNAALALVVSIFSFAGCLAPVDDDGSPTEATSIDEEVGEAEGAIAGTGDCVFQDSVRGTIVTAGLTDASCKASCQSSFASMSLDAIAQDCVWNHSGGTKTEVTAASMGACYVAPVPPNLFPIGAPYTSTDGVKHWPFKNGLTKAKCGSVCPQITGCTWRSAATGAYKNAPTNNELFVNRYQLGHAYYTPIVTQNVTTYTDALNYCRGIYSNRFFFPDGASDCVWVVAGTPTVVLPASQVGYCGLTKGASTIYTPGTLQTECAGTCTAATADHCGWRSYTGQQVQLW